MQLLTKLKALTGVVEVGLFCNMAKAAYFGNEVSVADAVAWMLSRRWPKLIRM